MDVTANAEAPPPQGSTARMKWDVPKADHPWGMCVSIGIACRGRSRRRSMSALAKALLLPSAETPIDSRSNIAGSSLRRAFTVSIFVLESHLGISASLCVPENTHADDWLALFERRGFQCGCAHFSGVSVRMQSSANDGVM